MGFCGDCRWWVKESDDVLSKGICRHSPPFVNFFGGTTWPKTSSTDRCSHFIETEESANKAPKYDSARADDTNIVNTIANTAGYKLLRCSLRPSTDDQWLKVQGAGQPLKKGLPYKKDRTKFENLSVEDDLVVFELELLGWMVVVHNGPFSHRLSNRPFFNPHRHREFGPSLSYPVTLIPITVSGTSIYAGYNRQITPFSHWITYDGIFLPGKPNVTPLNEYFIPIPMDSFKERALMCLVTKNNEAAELKKHEESSENN